MAYIGCRICSEKTVMIANDDITGAQKSSIPFWEMLGPKWKTGASSISLMYLGDETNT